VRVQGDAFGSVPGGSAVLFSGALSDVEAMIVSWSAEEIRVLVPATAIDGPVRARIGDELTNAIDFSVADSLISLREDLVPIFTTFQCMICHGTVVPGGTFRIADGLGQIDYPAMFTTGLHAPNIIARQSGASLIVQRVLPSAGALRMPQDAFPRYLNDAEILTIADWVDQGARNN
jgi:hypothetical protein